MKNRLPLFSRFFSQTSAYLFYVVIGLAGLITPAQATNTGVPTAPTALSVSVSSATVCAGTSTTLTASGCSTDEIARWSTNQTGNVIVVAPRQTTSYSVACGVTSTTVVSSTATATVQVYTPIVVSLEPIPTTCNNGQDGRIVVRATGGYGGLQYQIFGRPFQALNEFNGLQAGTYPITLKDDAGCTVQATTAVTQPSALSASVTVINPRCVGGTDGSLLATASGGVGDYRYALQNVTNPQTSGAFSNLVANTTYTLIVSDRNNCVLFQPVTVGQAAPFTVKLTPTPTRCVGTTDGSISVTATGGSGAYQYQLGNGPFQTGTQFTGLAAATYTVTVQDAIGCQGKQTVAVGQPAALTLTTVVRPAGCSGATTGVVTATALGGTGAVTYQLGNRPAQASPVFSGVSTGTYTILGTDANGCTGFASVTVVTANPLKIQASATAASCCNCPTGAVQITNTGGTNSGLQYQIVGRASQTASQIDKLPPGTYRIRVTDDGGCTDSTVTTVANANPLSLTTNTVKNVTCSGGQDGGATVQVAGGTGPFTYYWQTERRDTLTSRVASQTALAEGTYTVSVRDANQCTASTLFVTLTALNPLPPKPTISLLTSSTLVADQTTGIQWYVSTGASSVTAISNVTSATLVPYASGQYYATVIKNGCASLPSNVINFILLALTEPTAHLLVRVLPNPVTDRLRIEIEQPERSSVDVHLVDASGRLVGAYQLPAFTGKRQAEWPLAGVSTGAYLLKVASETRQSVLRVTVE